MPKILDDCVKDVMKQGKSKQSAFAICTASLKKAGKLSEEQAVEVLQQEGFEKENINSILSDKFSVIGEIKLAEDGDVTEIEMIKTGLFLHSFHGTLNISKKMFNSFMKNFRGKVIGRDIALDCEHDITLGACAWLEGLKTVRRNGSNGVSGSHHDDKKAGGGDKDDKKAGGGDKDEDEKKKRRLRDEDKERHFLVGKWRFTELGKELVASGQYKYFSLDFTMNFGDKEDETKFFGPTILGGALTNRPFIPGLRPIKVGDRVRLSEDENSDVTAYEEVYNADYEENNELENNEELNEENENVDLNEEEHDIKLAHVKDIPWSSVDKSKLPASAFAFVPDKEKRSTWKLSFKNPDGSLNPNGVSSAVVALSGADGGKPMKVSAEARKKINNAWEVVKAWRESEKKKEANKLNNKEVLSVSVKAKLQKELEDLKQIQETLEEGSDERKDVEHRITFTQEALDELEKAHKDVSDATQAKEEAEQKLSEMEKAEEEETPPEETPSTEEQPETQLNDADVIKLKDEMRKEIKAEYEADMASRDTQIQDLAARARKSDVEKNVMKFKEEGIPKTLIDWYEEVALNDETEAAAIKLSEGDNAGDYSATAVITKCFELLPEASRVKLAQKTTDKIDGENDEDKELVQLASDKVKAKKEDK